MNQIKICVAFIAFLVLYDVAEGKKSKRNKYQKTEDEEPSTLQPNVVAYSTFGFNDVGSHEGFIPTSPDYAKYLSDVNQDSTTRLYPPMYPTVADTTGFSSNFDSQAFDGSLFSMSDDSGPQSSMLQYPQSTINFFNTPNFETNDDQKKNVATEEIYGRNKEEFNEPVYGTKINYRNKNKPVNQFNHTEFKEYGSGPSSDKYFNFHEVQSTNKPAHGESSSNYLNNIPSYSSYQPSYPSTDIESFSKPSSNNMNGLLKFPKVVDFTKFKQYYPSGLDNTKFPMEPKPLNAYNSISSDHDNILTNTYSDFSKFANPLSFNDAYEFKNNDAVTEKNKSKPNSYSDSGSSYSYATTSHTKNILPSTKYNMDYKKKLKNKPSTFGNYSTDFKKWKHPYAPKGYEYSTNYSNTSFKYDVDESRKPFSGSNDEVIPASTNFDVSNYQYPETGFSSFKKKPDVKEIDEEDYSSYASYKDTTKHNDHINQYNDLFSTIPTTTSYWGNTFKTSEYSLFKNHPKKPQFNDDINDDVVNIPKRPNKWNNVKPFENKPIDWFQVNQKPYKLNKQLKDWKEEVANYRFKSEEDLLGLRNHDTSHPSYLPTYKPDITLAADDNDYKKLVDKWRQSYLRSKYKDSFRDYESYASEMKPLHVPVPKPYPIEVPHPVIVPVPQPYPVRVPVAKPVAVPVVREITVPIEKPVPYPVIKKVPYPVEKPVPVPVEKEVAVPVMKPYPVHIPYVRNVFHHSRPSHDEFDSGHADDDDYFPRMENNKRVVQYKKRPHGARNRRPSRTIYQDRNRRRWPDRRRPSVLNGDQRQYKRPSTVSDVFEDEHSDYIQYCKRTGNC